MSARDGFYVDFSNYKDRSSARVTEGQHLVRVTDAEAVETKKGDPMVNLFYEVVGGPDSGSPLIDRLVLTDKALWRVAKVMRALGFKVEKRNMNFSFKHVVGRTLVVTVSDGEPYNGEIRSEIRDYAPGASWKTETSELIEAEPETVEAFEDKTPEAQAEEIKEAIEDATEGFDIPEDEVKL